MRHNMNYFEPTFEYSFKSKTGKELLNLFLKKSQQSKLFDNTSELFRKMTAFYSLCDGHFLNNNNRDALIRQQCRNLGVEYPKMLKTYNQDIELLVKNNGIIHSIIDGDELFLGAEQSIKLIDDKILEMRNDMVVGGFDRTFINCSMDDIQKTISFRKQHPGAKLLCKNVHNMLKIFNGYPLTEQTTIRKQFLKKYGNTFQVCSKFTAREFPYNYIFDCSNLNELSLTNGQKLPDDFTLYIPINGSNKDKDYCSMTGRFDLENHGDETRVI